MEWLLAYTRLALLLMMATISIYISFTLFYFQTNFFSCYPQFKFSSYASMKSSVSLSHFPSLFCTDFISDLFASETFWRAALDSIEKSRLMWECWIHSREKCLRRTSFECLNFFRLKYSFWIFPSMEQTNSTVAHFYFPFSFNRVTTDDLQSNHTEIRYHNVFFPFSYSESA